MGDPLGFTGARVGAQRCSKGCSKASLEGSGQPFAAPWRFMKSLKKRWLLPYFQLWAPAVAATGTLQRSRWVFGVSMGSSRGLVSLQGGALDFLGALEGLFGTPQEASWSALGHLGALPEATTHIGTKARITVQGVWGPLTDTVNSICNQFTGISYQLLRISHACGPLARRIHIHIYIYIYT